MFWTERGRRNAAEQRKLGGGEPGVFPGHYGSTMEFQPRTGHITWTSKMSTRDRPEGEGPYWPVSKAKAFTSSALMNPVPQGESKNGQFIWVASFMWPT